MSLIWLVDGQRQHILPDGYDALRGARTAWWEWWEVDDRDRPVRALSAVDDSGRTVGGVSAKDCRLDIVLQRDVRGQGVMAWSSPVSDEPDWLTLRVSPSYHAVLADGRVVSWQMGVYHTTVTVRSLAHGRVTADVALHDKTVPLAEGGPTRPVSYGTGSVVVEKIRDIIEAHAGTRAHAIEDSDEVLRAPMLWDVWDEDISHLRRVNDLAEAIGYWSLSADYRGVLTSSKWVEPRKRPEEWGFGVDQVSAEPVVREQSPDVPNKVRLLTRGDDDAPAMSAYAQNDDPDSPWSVPNRGRIIPLVERGVEATTRTVLQSMADRRLATLTASSTSWTVDHAALPLPLSARVHLDRPASAVGVDGVVQSLSVPGDALAPWTTTLMEVQ